MSKKVTATLATTAALALTIGALFFPSTLNESEPVASGTVLTINETGEPVTIETETEPEITPESTPAPVVEAPTEIVPEPAPVEPATEAPTEIQPDQGFPLEEYGDGCKSYDTSPNWIICPTEAYSADMGIKIDICAQEDSRNCYWDAKRYGNGLGSSFINVEGVIFHPEESL